MEINRIYLGNSFELIKQLESDSIDCVITSPPYWLLRNYDIPDMDLGGWNGQLGHEHTYNMYLEHLWTLMDEIKRVLKPTGTCWVNLGDTYTSACRATASHSPMKVSKRHYSERTKISPVLSPDYGGSDKCKLMIPARFAIGCIDRGWTLRNDIVYNKINCTPESVKDRFSKKHEHLFFMVKNSKGYYFDLDAVRQKYTEESVQRDNRNTFADNGTEGGHGTRHRPTRPDDGSIRNVKQHLLSEKGANPGDVWDVTYGGGGNGQTHFAAYSNAFIDKPIIAGCPKGGIILDPFCGTGTTCLRAYQLDRKFIGFDGSPKYVELANKQLSVLLNQTQLF